MKIQLSKIAKIIKGEITGQKNLWITGISEIKNAKAGEIIFIENEKYLPYLEQSKASAVIIKQGIQNKIANLSIPASIKVENPYLAYAEIAKLFKENIFIKKGIHLTVIIDESSVIGKNISIGPYVVIGKNVKIGDEVIIFPHTYIGDFTKIGDKTIIYSNVSIREETIIGKRVIIHCGATIGSDGFKYIKVQKKHKKIPQIGKVIIEDEVEIGANTTIDRATIGITLIKKGTKIDNLVQIAHNVEIGENSIIVSLVGISGSVKIGKNVTLAGQSGVVDHVTIGNNTIIAAKAGVTKDIPENSIVSGFPAKAHTEEKRIIASLQQLPHLYKRIAELERKIKKENQ